MYNYKHIHVDDTTDKMYKMGQKFVPYEQIDPRILEIEKKAEQNYEQLKQEQKLKQTEQLRQQQLNDIYVSKIPQNIKQSQYYPSITLQQEKQYQQNRENNNKHNNNGVNIKEFTNNQSSNFNNNQIRCNISQPQFNPNSQIDFKQSKIPKFQVIENQQNFIRQTNLERNSSNYWEQDTEFDEESNTDRIMDQELYDNDQNKVKNKKMNVPQKNHLNNLIGENFNSDFNFYSDERQFQDKNSKNFKRKFLDNNSDLNYKKKKSGFNSTQLAFFEKQKQDELYKGMDVNRILLDSKILLNKQLFQEAESLLQQCINQNIEHSDIFYMMGETKRLLGKLKESEYFLLQAMQFKIHSPFIFNSLGLVYMEIEAYQRAILLFKKYLEINQDSKACFNLGRCLTREKDFTEAAIYFSKAIDLNGEEPYYYLHRGDCYEALGFMELSVKDYRQFKLLKPDYMVILRKQQLEAQNQQNKQTSDQIANYIKKLQIY